MPRLTNIILVLFLFFGVFSNVQSQVKVEVQDAKTSEPISFATIRFKGTKRGLVADYNGQFRLPLKAVEDSPILEITSVGYVSLKVDSKTLSTSEVNIVNMFPHTEALQEVIINSSVKRRASIKKVNKMLPIDIVRKAVFAIPLNLDNSAHSHIGYYRDYQIVDNEYYNLNEGIIEQYDQGIKSNKVFDSLNQSVLYSFKKNKEFNINAHYRAAYDNRTKFIQNAEILSYGGNELTILNVHNSIRNFDVRSFSFVYRMANEFLYNHKFSRGKISFIDNDPIIEITFTSISDKVSFQHKAEGLIRISTRDFSIYNFNYTVYDYNRLNPLFNIETAYRRQNNKMYLNYITFNNRFVALDDDVFKESNVIYNRDQNRFYVNFDVELDMATVHKRDFKISYKGRKVFIEKLVIEDSKQISLHVPDFDVELKALTVDEMPDLIFTIKNIYDTRNRKIYEGEKKIGYQFREYFVQEVITRKYLEENLNYMPKDKALSEAPINKNPAMDIYIVNSPLMERRMKKDKK